MLTIVQRLQAVLEDQQRRRKVGGVVDKRFGENDPTMALEDKMLERFTREKQLRHKNSSAFDLEDEDEPGLLTHMGQSLSLDGPALVDDFDEDDLKLSDAEAHPSDEERRALKRRRSDIEDEDGSEDEEDERPERKKPKQEVMKELIAKSKLHKYERQAAKDDDEDVREDLDKGLSNIHELLRGVGQKTGAAFGTEVSGMNPDRAALMDGTSKNQTEKEYDLRLRQLAQDKRAKPTEKSKTEEQIAEERARKIQELQAKAQRRMQGAPESSDEEEERGMKAGDDGAEEKDDFGLGSGIKARPTMAELGVEDEDDFIIDEDLVASVSNMESDDDSESSEERNPEEEAEDEDEDDEFTEGLLSAEEATRPEFLTGANAPIPEVELPAENGVNGELPYVFDCPQSHDELLEVFEDVNILDIPTAIQRIRALYHPKLSSENKEKLANFAIALIDHVSYLADQEQGINFAVLQSVIRHIHSFAKKYPVQIANSFRRHLKELAHHPLSPTPGDLVLLTAIGTIFPASDHFHQVVTPAILSMGRYLGLKIPHTLSDLATGAYFCALCLQYQKTSKRYMPELLNYIENALCVLAPTKLFKLIGNFPYHEPKTLLQIKNTQEPIILVRKMQFYDCVPKDLSEKEEELLKAALLDTNLSLLDSAARIWADKPAFTEAFAPTLTIVHHLLSKNCRPTISASTQVRELSFFIGLPLTRSRKLLTHSPNNSIFFSTKHASLEDR
jgi:nucleolar protein 14